jgi:hypothetical protein
MGRTARHASAVGHLELQVERRGRQGSPPEARSPRHSRQAIAGSRTQIHPERGLLYRVRIVSADVNDQQRNPLVFSGPLVISPIALVVILAAAFAGLAAMRRLPPQHLSADSQSSVSVSMAVVATLWALVLGLLMSNANSTFTAVGAK